MMKRVIAAVLAALTLVACSPALAKDELKNTDPEKYYILLDLNNQIVTVYEKDKAGEYTKIVRRFLCTTGKTSASDPESIDPLENKGTPTPRGIYKTGGHERFGKFASFGATYARYWTQIVGGVFFHSIMFTRRDLNTLERAAYSNLGRNVSHGCVRLYVEDAKWLYYYIPIGTTIRVSTNEDSNPKLKKAPKYSMDFKAYDAFQKTIYDDPELPNDIGYVTVDGADVRNGNGSNDRRLFTLKRGEQVEILQIGDPWLKVKYNGREGYIKCAFVTLNPNETHSKEDADIIRGTVYMLVEPDEKANVIVKVPTYTSVEVLETIQDGKWVKIRYFNEEGYIKASSLVKGWGLIRG